MPADLAQPPSATDATGRGTAAPSSASAAAAPAMLAKAALRRLALERLEPTPEHYAVAYAREAADAGVAVDTPARRDGPPLRLVERLAARGGLDDDARRRLADAVSTGGWVAAERLLDGLPAAGESLAGLIERLVRGLEIGGKQWTRARRRDSLQRVLAGSRSDAQRLQARLSQLVASWQDDRPDGVADTPPAESGPAVPVPAPAVTTLPAAAAEPAAPRAADPATDGLFGPAVFAALGPWRRCTGALGGTVGAALPRGRTAAAAVLDASPEALADRLARVMHQLQDGEPSDADAADIEALCAQADRVLQHREHLVDQLGRLCQELTASLGDLAEDDSWTRGQCDAMRGVLDEGLSTRGVRAVGDLLRATRERQSALRTERDRARDALKGLLQRMLGELGELGAHTGRFQDSMERYTGVIEQADSLESLAGVVREMVEESRTVAGLVHQTQSRLNEEHGRARVLADRVQHLEGELRRLSAEVSTDQLTQVANRRGLLARFEVEQARLQREGSTLTVGLLDIDNFKRLNDELGHAAGDVALKSLAQVIQEKLRPTDMVARFGGEEFVVLLPATPADEGQRILTRLQRSLSGSLFMHEAKPVFVTFSAGVTAYRCGEPLEAALERADSALYQAKRTGKNRTCLA